MLAVGKAAVPMSAAAEEKLGRYITAGVAVTQARTPHRLRRVKLLLSSHPVPDERGLRAAMAIEHLLKGLSPDDLVVALVSGGASALLPAPCAGIRLDDKQVVTARLLASGAAIHEINMVRKHLSRFKGGGLARLCSQARVLVLALSDVVGDDMATIASGPFSPDPTTFRDALDVLHRCRVAVPKAVRRHLEAGAAGRHAETPKPGDRVFRRVAVRIVGNNSVVLRAAAKKARRLGYRTQVIAKPLQGEARIVGPRLVRMLRRAAGTSRSRPLTILAGGETTVTIRGPGRGGRNLELAASAVAALARLPFPVVLASVATDGLDGNSGAAGAIVDTSTLSRSRDLGLMAPRDYLARSDTAAFLEPLGDLVRTGPTGTNLLDVTIFIALPS